MIIFFYLFFISVAFSLVSTIYFKTYKNASTVFGGGGGGGGGKGASGGKDATPSTPTYVAPAAAPAAPTADSSATADAVTASQKQRAAAAGLASTDVTGGQLGAAASTLNKQSPTLLGQ